jgi:hypothetical protein
MAPIAPTPYVAVCRNRIAAEVIPLVYWRSGRIPDVRYSSRAAADLDRTRTCTAYVVGDRFVDRQGRTLGPCGFKVLLAHSIT